MQNSQRGMERRIVAQLFDSIDFISSLGNSSSNNNNDENHSTNNNGTNTDSSGVSDSITGQIIGGIMNGNNKVGGVVDVVPAAEVPAKSKLVILIAATNK